MPNMDTRVGLAGGPDLHICSADGAQDKTVDLDAGGVLRLGGVSVAMLADLDTLAEINAIIADGTLIDTSDARLSDARTPLGHSHAAGDLNSGEVLVVRGGTGSGTASGARTNLGLAIGSAIQAFDAGLLSIAGLATAADEMIYTTGSDAYAVAALSAYARTLLDDTDAAAARATLVLETMSQAEAEAGTATTTRAITAQRIKQAIAKLGGDLILSQTASASATIEFTSAHITSTYDTYMLVIEHARPATDNVQMWFRVSTDGGSTWKSGASDYEYSSTGWHSNTGSAVSGKDIADSEIAISHSELTNVAADALSGVYYLHSPSNTATHTRTSGTCVWRNKSNSRGSVALHGGVYLAVTAVNGLQILMSAGNITSGRFTLYGMPHV